MLLTDGADVSARDATGACLFFFGGPNGSAAPSVARCGPYKHHWATGPGLSGCDGCAQQVYDPLLLFNVEADPSEQFPFTTNGTHPESGAVHDLLARATAALAAFMVGYTPGNLTLANGGDVAASPQEQVNGTGFWGVCCDRQAANSCDCNGLPYFH